MSTKFNIYEYLKSNPRNLYLSDEEINFMRSAGYSDEEMDEAADPEAKQRSQEQFIRTVGGIPQTLMQGLVDLTHTMYDATAETAIAGVDPISGMVIPQDPRITQEQKEEQLAASKKQSQESVDYLQKEILQGLYSSVMGDQNVEMVERNGNFVAAIKKPEGTALNLTRGVGTFAAEFAGLNKLLGPAKAKSRLGKITDYTLRGEAVAQVAINPYEENLANILGSYIANLNISDREGILADVNNLLYSYREPLQKTLPTLEKFYYEKGDSSLEARSKLLFEGLVLTLGIESVVGLGLVSARGLRTIKKDAKAYSELPDTDVKPKKKAKEKSYYIDEKGTKVEFDMPTAGETIKQLSKETLEDLKNSFIGILKNISKDETKIDDFITALTNSFKISKKEKGSSLYETIKKRRIEEIEAGNVKGYGDLDAVKNLFGLVKSRYQGNNNSVINWLGKTRDYIFSTKASGMPDRLFRAFDVKEGKTAEWLKIIEFTARDFEAGLDDLFGYIGKGKPELLAKVNKIIDTDYRLSEEGKYLLGGRTTRRKNKYQQKKFLESLKELPEVLQEPVRKMRSITDRLTESAMKNADLTKDELKDFREGLGSYMRVSYEAYENASFYPTRSAEQTLKSELREFYIKNFPEKATDPVTGEQFIKDKIAQDLDQILNRDGDTIRKLYKTIEGYKKTETITKERKLKDKTIKTFLGEIEDPLDRFLLSTVKVVRYVEDMKYYKQTYEDGLGIWLFDPTRKIIDSTKKTETSDVIPTGFNSVIPDNHGPLSGLHTSPEINRFIQGLNEGQVFATRDKGNKLWEFTANGLVRYGSYNSFLKYEATVGSFASAFKNFFGSGTMNTQQGINPFSKEYVEGISNVVHEFMRGTDKQKQEIILRIAKHNLLGKTVEIADIEGALYELGKIQRGRNNPERILESILKQELSLPVPRLKDGSVDWTKADVSIKKIFDKGGEWYRGGDEAWKIGMFLHEAKHYKKIQDALPKNNPKAQKYIADPDEQAADIVKRSLQNYDRVSTFAKQLKSIPRFGQFYSFNQESVRIFLTTFKTLFEEGVLWRNMKNDGFDEAAELVRDRVLKRAVGFVSTNLAWSPKVTTGVLGYLYFKEGDKEDHQQKTIEAFKSLGPEWYKHANLVVIRNEKGQPVAIDLSSWNPEQYPIDFLMPWITKALTVDPLKYNEAETMSDFVSEIVSKWAEPWLGQDLASEVLAPFLTVNTEMQGQVINSVGNMVPVSAKQDSSWTYQKDINATWLDNFTSNFGLMMNNVLYQAAPRTVTQAISFANDKTVAELEDVEYNEGLALLKIITGAGGLAGTEDFITYGLNQKITTYKNIKSDLVQDLRRQIKTVKTTNDFKEKYLDVNLQLLEAQRELIKAFVGANFIAENFSDSDTERANLELRIAILDTLKESGLNKRDTVPITFAMYADTAYFEPIDLIAEAEDTTIMRMLETGGQQKENVFDMYTDIVLELQQEMRQIPIYTELETIDYDRNYFEKTKEKIVEEGRQQKFQGGAISEDYPVSNVNLVPSERVDKNTGMPYEAEMERLGFTEGGTPTREERIAEREERDRIRKQKEEAIIKGIDENLNPLQKASLIPVPIASDIAGVAGDVQMYLENPETRSAGNYMLSAAGLLPFVPAVGSIKALPKTYHGTKKPIPSKLEKYEDYTSKGSIYGDGLYTTSKKDTAKGYAGDKGIIYETTPKKRNTKLFNMDDKIPSSIKQELKKYSGEFENELLDFIDENPKASLVNLYDEMRDLAPYRQTRSDHVYDIIHDLNNVLRKEGYKGLRHRGGVLTGNPEHEVNIFFNPQKDLNINPVSEWYTDKQLKALKRKSKKDGGLLVSIGLAPVSEKDISKLKKSLKKRQDKRNGGRLGFNTGSAGNEQYGSLPLGTGASEDQRDPTEWRDYSARDPQMDPYRYGSQEADDYANWMDAQIARDEAYDYSSVGNQEVIESPVTYDTSNYQTNFDYFLPSWNSVVENAPRIFNRWLSKGRTGLIMSNTSEVVQNTNDGKYYIVPLYNTETGNKYESDEDMWNQVGPSIEEGTLAGYGSQEEAEIDRKELYDTLIRDHGLDTSKDTPNKEENIKEEPKRKGGNTGGTVRNYAKEYANYHSSEKQKKDRAHRNNANRKLKREGRIAKGDGKDVDHKDGNPRNNSPSNLTVKKKESNRSFSRRLAARNGGDVTELSDDQKQYIAFYNMAVKAGNSFPEIVAAQASLESTHGTSALTTDYNNPLGIKVLRKAEVDEGQKSILMNTKEFKDGKEITSKEPFRVYDSMEESFVGYKEKVAHPRYDSIRKATNKEEYAKALQKSGYASDPEYANKIIGIADRYSPLINERQAKANGGLLDRQQYSSGNNVKNLYTTVLQGTADLANIDFRGMDKQGRVTAEEILNMQEENIGRKKPYTDAEIESIAEIARHIDIAGSAARKNPTRDMPRMISGPYGDIGMQKKRPAISNLNKVLLQGKEIGQVFTEGYRNRSITKGLKDSRKDWGNNKIGFNLGQQNLNATDEEWQEIIRDTINDSLQRRKQGLDHRKGIDVIF